MSVQTVSNVLNAPDVVRPETAARVREVQLAVYRLAYSRWSGLPPEDIDAAFYYAATGTTVHPPMPQEDELVALLVDLTAGEV